MKHSEFRTFFILTAVIGASLSAAADTELKDASGKTVIQYVVETPAGMAHAGTTDPARQLGLISLLPGA